MADGGFSFRGAPGGGLKRSSTSSNLAGGGGGGGFSFGSLFGKK